MAIENTLEDIGLTKNEVKIYLALLELGLTTTGPIIKKTSIHNSKVYDGLERLTKKGLVSYITKANTKHFKAVNPERILDFLEEKKKQITNQEKQAKKIIPELKLKQQYLGTQTEAEIFKGWKGMHTVYYKMLLKTLKKGETNYVFGASKGEDEERTRRFFNHYVRELAKKKIKMKIIYNESARGNIPENLRYPNLFEIRHMINTTPAEINIWGEHIMIVILRSEPTVILVKDKKVAESFKTYFNLMWETARK